MSANSPIYTIKLYLLGNSTVGKTSLVYKYIKNEFRNHYLSTIGFENTFKDIVLDNGERVKINFHDTAGQEKYRSLAFNSIKSASGVILMYDITNKDSFKSIPQWISSIRQHKGEDFPIVLIGNKCDLKEEREIKTEEGNDLANKYGFLFFETSSKEGINIKESILELVLKIVDQKNQAGKNEEKKEGGKQKNFKLEKDKNLKKNVNCIC